MLELQSGNQTNNNKFLLPKVHPSTTRNLVERSAALQKSYSPKKKNYEGGLDSDSKILLPSVMTPNRKTLRLLLDLGDRMKKVGGNSQSSNADIRASHVIEYSLEKNDKQQLKETLISIDIEGDNNQEEADDPNSGEEDDKIIEPRFTERVNRRLEQFERYFGEKHPALAEQQKNCDTSKLITALCNAVDPVLTESLSLIPSKPRIDTIGDLSQSPQKRRTLRSASEKKIPEFSSLTSLQTKSPNLFSDGVKSNQRSKEKALTSKSRNTSVDRIDEKQSGAKARFPSLSLTETDETQSPYEKHLHSNIFLKLNSSLPKRMKFQPLERKRERSLDQLPSIHKNRMRTEYTDLNSSLEMLQYQCYDTMFDNSARDILDKIAKDVRNVQTPRMKIRKRAELYNKDLKQVELIEACKEAMKVRLNFEMTHMRSIEPVKIGRSRRPRLATLAAMKSGNFEIS